MLWYSLLPVCALIICTCFELFFLVSIKGAQIEQQNGITLPQECCCTDRV